MMVFLLTDEELRITKIYANGIGNTELAEKRKKEMLLLRMEKKWSLQRIGNRYGITRQRVAQIIGKTGRRNGGLHYSSSLALRELENKRDYFFDKTVADISEEFGVSRDVASDVMGNYYHAIEATNEFSPRAAGQEWEIWSSQRLEGLGIKNELMPLMHPFDILALSSVRVDVKSTSKPYKIPPSQSYMKFANPRYAFNVGRDRDKTDFYMCIIADTEDVFIIPSQEIPSYRSPLIFSWPIKRPDLANWQNYHNRYDLIIAHSINT